MRVSREDIVALRDELVAVLSQQLASQGQEFRQQLASQGQEFRQQLASQGQEFTKQIGELQARMDKMDRTVSAIESFPVPYGRPKVFFSATTMHSVSHPVRERQGSVG